MLFIVIVYGIFCIFLVFWVVGSLFFFVVDILLFVIVVLVVVIMFSVKVIVINDFNFI